MRRPRFSLRTLAIVVTLICAYIATWEATKAGLPRRMEYLEITTGRLFFEGDIQIHVMETGAPMPFITWRDEIELLRKQNVGYDTISQPTRISRGYYLWLLGPTIKLPFESEYGKKWKIFPSLGAAVT